MLASYLSMKPLITDMNVGTRPPIILQLKMKLKTMKKESFGTQGDSLTESDLHYWINGALGADPSYLYLYRDTIRLISISKSNIRVCELEY